VIAPHHSPDVVIERVWQEKHIEGLGWKCLIREKGRCKMINQKMTIVSKGMIENGSISFTANAKTGEIAYQANFEANFFLFSKAYPFSGAARIAPKYLLSENIQIGLKVKLGALTIQIAEVVLGKSADVVISIEDNDIQERGHATLDLTDKEIKLTQISLKGKISGSDVELIAIDQN
jgi:hypothetical protein